MSWSVFYYHHAPSVLNTINDKILCPGKSIVSVYVQTIKFTNIPVKFKLAHFYDLSLNKKSYILHGS